MKKRRTKLFVGIALLMTGVFGMIATAKAEDLTRYVDPRIGTAHSRYFHFAPGARPFGMAKPGPSTNGHLGNKDGWEATGYDYRDTTIEGFPSFHEFQVGGVVLMPTVGVLKTTPGAVDGSSDGYRSAFERKDEVATAGYYSVLLKRYNTKAEMTATNRVVFQRYTYPKNNASHILFDIGNRQGESGAVVDAKVYRTDEGRIEGYVITKPEYVKKYQKDATVAMYFSATIDKTPTAFGSFQKDNITPGAHSVSGIGSGFYLTFDTQEGEKISVTMGLSYTSIENARANYLAEAKGKNFDQVRHESQKAWNDYLGRIRVEGKDESDKIKFYTGLYHAILGRGLASDVNGAYPKNDGTVGQIPLVDGSPKHNHYNTDAMWGGYWNLSQLWSLAYPEYLSDFIQSQLLVYKDSGWLADGIANSKYVSGVGTNFIGLIIANAYAVGIRDFDIELAYQAALNNELNGTNRPKGAGKSDTDQFVKFGYVPHRENADGIPEDFQFSASHTLEYSFSAYALAQMAKELGHTDDYKKLMWLSKGWERIYDNQTSFVRPKDSLGNFINNFNPRQAWRGFQEGNAWQYSFYVPHDADQLAKKMGYEVFANRLDSIFTESQKLIFGGGKQIDAFAGLENLYNHGNQPCLHIPWMFYYASRPSLSQKWVRSILDEFYGTQGVHGYGYGQDEDQGQLGAWYAISSIGLFDVKGLSGPKPTLSIGSPLFDKITIELNKNYYPGDKIVIETVDNSKQNRYVNQLKINGKPSSALSISFEELVKGAHLQMKMGDTPKDNY